MTIRNAFENILIELNKVQAPSILLDDFIYLFNKGIQQYINKRYNLFEIQQQLTDDLRVLLKSEIIQAPTSPIQDVFGQSYEFTLPSDYMHILNCVCKFKVLDPICDEDYIFVGANKLTTNQWPHVINNFYMKPSVTRPYYYMVNTSDPTKTGISDDIKKTNTRIGLELRYGNSVIPKLLIKCGNTDKYKLESIQLEYLRTPEYLSVDRELMDRISDDTQKIEFPDYVVYEIINGIVSLIMENNGNPRVQSHLPINTSIPQK